MKSITNITKQNLFRNLNWAYKENEGFRFEKIKLKDMCIRQNRRLLHLAFLKYIIVIFHNSYSTFPVGKNLHNTQRIDEN